MTIRIETSDEASIGRVIDILSKESDEKIRQAACQLENEHFGVEPHLQEHNFNDE